MVAGIYYYNRDIPEKMAIGAYLKWAGLEMHDNQNVAKHYEYSNKWLMLPVVKLVTDSAFLLKDVVVNSTTFTDTLKRIEWKTTSRNVIPWRFILLNITLVVIVILWKIYYEKPVLAEYFHDKVIVWPFYIFIFIIGISQFFTTWELNGSGGNFLMFLSVIASFIVAKKVPNILKSTIASIFCLCSFTGINYYYGYFLNLIPFFLVFVIFTAIIIVIMKTSKYSRKPKY